jgi:hypothetical protein
MLDIADSKSVVSGRERSTFDLPNSAVYLICGISSAAFWIMVASAVF